MLLKADPSHRLPLLIPCSTGYTLENKTGSWRFFRPRYVQKTAPCRASCPAGEDLARIQTLVSRGLVKKAWEQLVLENPFPAVCGRVCFHPCEKACNRGRLDEAVAVHALERGIGDAALDVQRFPAPAPAKSARRVAIVGAGPAGLAAAYFLSRLGHRCEIFESRAQPGGLLRWGIPAYRLPPAVVEKEIGRIARLGVAIHCRTAVDEALFQKLVSSHDACLVACGYNRPIALNIAGGHYARDGLQFLEDLRGGKRPSFNGPAAVIGGGNTAIDVARGLVRCGAKPILVYRRTLADMPAFAPEITMALEEGVKLMELAAPLAIEKTGAGAAPAAQYILKLQKMEVSDRPIGGRARVIPAKGRQESLRVQQVFAAIGAAAHGIAQAPAAAGDGLVLSHCQFRVREKPLVFIGDPATPVKSVAHAIGSGKQAALALDTLFRKGYTKIEDELAACQIGPGPALSMAAYQGIEAPPARRVVAFEELNCAYFESAARAVLPRLGAGLRRTRFAEIEAGLSGDALQAEARRCFACGTCNACDNCRLFCPEMAVVAEKGTRRIDYDYCKGCGICVAECPRSAMTMEEEPR